jgi:hypothetical protein
MHNPYAVAVTASRFQSNSGQFCIGRLQRSSHSPISPGMMCIAPVVPIFATCDSPDTVRPNEIRLKFID